MSTIARQRRQRCPLTPACSYLNKVIVAEVTSTIRDIPQEVPLAGDEGLPRPSVANLDNLYVLAKSLLSVRIGALSKRRENDVKRALGYALDWLELKVL